MQEDIDTEAVDLVGEWQNLGLISAVVNFVEIHNFFFETLGARFILESGLLRFFGVVLITYLT